MTKIALYLQISKFIFTLLALFLDLNIQGKSAGIELYILAFIK